MTNLVDDLVELEWKEGRSAGAAARQVCRSLDPQSPLKRLLEELLADGNRRSFDRSMILRDFEDAAPVAGRQAHLRSFRRINNMETA